MTKRFYKDTAAEAKDDGFTVTLDGRAIKTPAHKPLVVPSEPLAQAIAEEWAAQGEELKPHTMPLMKLAGTAIDRVANTRDELVKGTVTYAGSDAMCYRPNNQPDLAERQNERWEPILDWAAESLGARLVLAEGILHVTQSDEALAALHAKVDSYGVFKLTAVADLTGMLGSLILALALVDGRVTALEAYELALLEEIYQSELWGEDYEAIDRRAALKLDVEKTYEFFSLLS